MKVYFPDTNFFFECRKASDLPWHELQDAKPGEGQDVRLIVPSTVVTEIERHKANGNSRTAKRARDASAVLRQALSSQAHSTELRGPSPRVTLELPPVVKVDFTQFPNLDPARADHHIAAEYAELLKREPDLIVLTDDTLLVLALRSLGFQPILIPETWKLAPEKDERDDEIDRLRDELRTFKNNSPDLSVAVLNDDGDEIKTLEAEIKTFEASDSDIEMAVTALQARFQMHETFRRSQTASQAIMSLSKCWRPPSDEEIERYKSEAYPNWLESLRNALPALASRLNGISREMPFTVRICNAGFANASNVRLTITAYDGVLLLDGLDDEAEAERAERLRFPSPPKPPQGRYLDLALLHRPIVPIAQPHLLRDLRMARRDPTDFYFAGGRPGQPAHELELTCEAFPHQDDPYRLGFRAIVPEGGLGKKPRLRIRVQASNLRKPLETFLPLSVTFARGDLLERLNDIENPG